MQLSSGGAPHEVKLHIFLEGTCLMSMSILTEKLSPQKNLWMCFVFTLDVLLNLNLIALLLNQLYLEYILLYLEYILMGENYPESYGHWTTP